MSNKDFQNGFIVGLASKGKTVQKPVVIKTGTEVFLPVYAEPITIETSSTNIQIETSVVLEESGE